MPELAEVETVRREIALRMSGRKIKNIVADTSDRYLFAFTSIEKVSDALVGARVVGTGRKGKYFWIELNRKPWPIFHLGMSGNIIIFDPKEKNLKPATQWGRVHQDEKLGFCRLKIEGEGGVEMAFTDPRRFGRMWLTDDPWKHPRILALGYDPLLDFPSPKVLAELLIKKKKPIKSVLLDQKLFAGVGNWLADEILYHSKIAPHRLASRLSPAELKTLHKQVLHVVKKAVAVGADDARFPRTWLFHHRWGKGKNARTSRGQTIIFDEVGGRTTAWVPGWQT